MIKKFLKSVFEDLYWRLHDKKVRELRKKITREDLSPGFYRLLDQPWLRQMNIRTVIDIGASVGDFSKTAFAIFEGISVYAFEPLPDEFAKMNSRMNRIGPFKAFNVALGDQEGQISFHVNAHSPSSSLLTAKQTLQDHFSFTGQGQQLAVPVRRLDSFYPEMKLERNVLVKMDVQGGEVGVIRGAKKVLAETKIVIVETSFEELYQDQPLFDEVYRQMKDLGFQYHGSFGEILSPVDRQPLQQDSIYIRR